jgi:hypothetical protein
VLNVLKAEDELMIADVLEDKLIPGSCLNRSAELRG